MHNEQEKAFPRLHCRVMDLANVWEECCLCRLYPESLGGEASVGPALHHDALLDIREQMLHWGRMDFV